METKRFCCLLGIVFAIGLMFFAASVSPGSAASEPVMSQGQTVYVSVYSNIYSTTRQIPFNLSNILSIRNTDMHNAIQVTAADYYGTKGKLIKKYYQAPVTVAPLETIYVYIPEEDTAGGFGANFIVKWRATKEVNAPIIECLMIGMKGGQGISFVSPAQVIRENTR